MNKTDDAPTTTGLRVWALIWRLMLPWAFCGGLLWTLVGLTPDITSVDGSVLDDLTSGLAVEPSASQLHPWGIKVFWNPAGWIADAKSNLGRLTWLGRRTRPMGSPTAGVEWMSGGSTAGSFVAVAVAIWWLIPAPLLWSGFNLWRWVRRAK